MITDINGNSQYFDITVANNTSVEVIFEGLSEGNMIVNISSKICNTSKNLVCQKCNTVTVTGIACESPVCKVCVTGESGSYIDIVYLLDSKYTSTRILAGQCNYIPKSATVVGVERVNDAVESSDCLDLIDVEEKKCYYISWAVTDNGDSSTQAWDNHSATQKLTSYSALGVTYTLDVDIYDPYSVITAISSNGLLNSIITDILPIDQPIADLYAKGFSFKTIPSVAESLYLLTDGGVAGVSKIKISGTEYECGTEIVIPGS